MFRKPSFHNIISDNEYNDGKIHNYRSERTGDLKFTIIGRSGLAQSVAHQTLGRGFPCSIPIRGIICCGLEQVTFPQLSVNSVHMFLK